MSLTTEVMTGVIARPAVRTAAWKIFHVFYQCRIEQMYLYSSAYTKVAGIYAPPGQDTSIVARQMVDVNLTIAAMAELFEEGASVQLPIPENTLAIYEILHQHLSDWRNQITQSINRGKVPMDDLVQLDRFAGHVWIHAKHYIDRGVLKDPFGRVFRPMVNRHGLKEHPQVPIPAAHTPLIQDLDR